MKKKNSNKVYGIKTITVNDVKVCTINIIINTNPTILSKILNDEFWKLNHQISMRNGISKVHFVYTTLDEEKFYTVKQSLLQLLFAHKLNNLFNSSYYVNDKELIAYNILSSQVDEKYNSSLIYDESNMY